MLAPSLATWANSIVMALKLKRLFPPPPPKRDCLFAFFTLQLGSDGKERAQQDGAIIVGQFDQPRLLHQPA